MSQSIELNELIDTTCNLPRFTVTITDSVIIFQEVAYPENIDYVSFEFVVAHSELKSDFSSDLRA